MIQLSGAGKRFGHKLLFENADWLITPRDRIEVLRMPFARGEGFQGTVEVVQDLTRNDNGRLLPQRHGSPSGAMMAGSCR